MTGTKAEVVVPSIIPDVSLQSGQAVGVSTVLGLVIWAIFHFRRRASRDGTEIVKDRVEGQLINDMLRDREALIKEKDAERDEAKRAWVEFNKMSVDNAKLRSDNDYLQREIVRLTAAMIDLQKQFDEIRARLQHLSKGATGYSGYSAPI